MKKRILILTIILSAIASIVYAMNIDPRSNEVSDFYKGHYHTEHQTINAPQHSGGTNAYGCHNGSVPYHCH